MRFGISQFEGGRCKILLLNKGKSVAFTCTHTCNLCGGQCGNICDARATLKDPGMKLKSHITADRRCDQTMPWTQLGGPLAFPMNINHSQPPPPPRRGFDAHTQVTKMAPVCILFISRYHSVFTLVLGGRVAGLISLGRSAHRAKLVKLVIPM